MFQIFKNERKITMTNTYIEDSNKIMNNLVKNDLLILNNDNVRSVDLVKCFDVVIADDDMSIVYINKDYACIHTSYGFTTADKKLSVLEMEETNGNLSAIKLKMSYRKAEEFLTMLGYLIEECISFGVVVKFYDGTKKIVGKFSQSMYSNYKDWKVTITPLCDECSDMSDEEFFNRCNEYGIDYADIPEIE